MLYSLFCTNILYPVHAHKVEFCASVNVCIFVFLCFDSLYVLNYKSLSSLSLKEVIEKQNYVAALIGGMALQQPCVSNPSPF